MSDPTPKCPKGHGEMTPVGPTTGLDPWLGQWWECSHVEHVTGQCGTRTLEPSVELLAQEAELAAEQAHIEGALFPAGVTA